MLISKGIRTEMLRNKYFSFPVVLFYFGQNLHLHRLFEKQRSGFGVCIKRSF